MTSLPITGEIVLLFLAVLGAVGGLWWRIESRFAVADEARAILQKELSEYKLYVSQNHVSSITLREMEQRLSAVMEKLANRLEAIVNRLDDLHAHRPARQP